MCQETVHVYKQSYSGRLFYELTTEQAVLAHITQPHAPAAGPAFPGFAPEVLNAYKMRP